MDFYSTEEIFFNMYLIIIRSQKGHNKLPPSYYIQNQSPVYKRGDQKEHSLLNIIETTFSSLTI
jgi:hypothetical protein